MDVKIAAKILFDSGVSQRDIAAIVKKSENTISTWAIQGDWERKRADRLSFQDTAEERIRSLISHNLKVLQKIAHKLEESITDDMDVHELQGKLIHKGEADSLSKLFSQIRGREMDWGKQVELIREFLEFIEGQRPELAKDLTLFTNDFLNQKRRDA